MDYSFFLTYYSILLFSTILPIILFFLPIILDYAKPFFSKKQKRISYSMTKNRQKKQEIMTGNYIEA